MKKQTYLAFAFLIVILCFSATGLADTVTVGPRLSNWNYHISSSTAGISGQYYGSPEWITFGNGDKTVGYCVDLFHQSQSPAVVQYDSMLNWNLYGDTLSSADRGKRAAWLLDHFKSGVDTQEEYVALQLAIWEVLFEDGAPGYSYDVTAGTGFAASNPQGSGAAGAFGTANGYLADLATALGSPGGLGSADATWLKLTTATGTDAQDFMVESVPEPSTVLLLGSGLLLFGIIIRRRQLSVHERQ